LKISFWCQFLLFHHNEHGGDGAFGHAGDALHLADGGGRNAGERIVATFFYST